VNDAIRHMLAPYRCSTTGEYLSALREILQSLALLELWRAKFFEHAAFYGDTALRVLHGLDRFSEDLDAQTGTWTKSTFREQALPDPTRSIGAVLAPAQRYSEGTIETLSSLPIDMRSVASATGTRRRRGTRPSAVIL
jgi:hypothetical protein